MTFWRAVGVAVLIAGADGAAFRGKQGHLDLEYMIIKTPQAQDNIRYLKSFVRNHMLPPPHINLKIESHGPCFFQHLPLIPASEAIEVRIVANEDDEVVTGPHPVTIDIRLSTARVDVASTGWRLEDEQSSSLELAIGSSIFGSDSSVTLSSSNTLTKEKSGGTELQHEHQLEVSKSFECSAYTICSVQTWTYVAKIKGKCPRIPMVDTECTIKRAYKYMCATEPYNPICPKPTPIEMDFWESMEYLLYSRRRRKRAAQDYGADMLRLVRSPFFNTLYENSWLSGNISLPSINEQWPAWDEMSRKYYNMTKKDGSPAGKVLPANLVSGIWRASEDEYKIEYKSTDRCNFSTPLYLSQGKPKRTQVIIERAIDISDVRFGSRLLEKRGKSPIKVTVLSNELG